MRQSMIFHTVLEAVSLETELSPDMILSSSRQEEVVDARYLLVFLLYRCGCTRSRIAGLIRQSPRSVGYILSLWDVRLRGKHILRINLENVRKQLGNNFSLPSL